MRTISTAVPSALWSGPNWWTNRNPYHMPGTTVDTQEREAKSIYYKDVYKYLFNGLITINGKNAYDLDFSIAKLNDGNYVAYAKRNLTLNKELLNKIKKEMPRSKSSLTSLSYVNKIPQSNNNVNNDISSC